MTQSCPIRKLLCLLSIYKIVSICGHFSFIIKTNIWLKRIIGIVHRINSFHMHLPNPCRIHSIINEGTECYFVWDYESPVRLITITWTFCLYFLLFLPVNNLVLGTISSQDFYLIGLWRWFFNSCKKLFSLATFRVLNRLICFKIVKGFLVPQSKCFNLPEPWFFLTGLNRWNHP